MVLSFRPVAPFLLGLSLLLPWAVGWADLARAASGRRFAHKAAPFRVVVLGFDGVDPDILREHLASLPAVARLARNDSRAAAESGYLSCRTTDPPESPVAWATFATGRNPGGHGIFDFVRRDPASETPYQPLNGMVDRVPPLFGPLDLPLRPPTALNLLSGETFWERVAKGGYRVSVLRMPLTFPAELPRGGELLCGLGVPDLRGTNGSYTLFAAGINAWMGDTVFGGRHIKLYPRKGEASALLEGPIDPRPSARGKRLEVPIAFRFENEAAVVTLPGEPPLMLTRDRFSRWMRVHFTAGPFVNLHGLVRFLLLRTGPEAAVYASPIQIAPHAPPIPISAPFDFARTLAQRLGPMKTAGWPEDTFAANDRVLGDVHVYRDIEDTYRSDERLLLDRLDHSGAALVSMVFTAQDRMSHLFFRWRDPRHPLYDEAARAAFRGQTGVDDPILESYRWMDETLGAVLARLSPQDLLLVVSDHGFHSWRMGVNLNTWLAENGYLTPAHPGQADASRTLAQFFRLTAETSHIDWSRTRAYALGLGQIYLNLEGREAGGIVEPAEARALVEEIAAKLRALRSPDGEPVMKRVILGGEIWRGERMGEAPELQCAFASGYRVSWQTALLGMPPKVFEENDYPWSGDHCSNDAEETAGILLSNWALGPGASPGLEDIAPTVCALFGLPPPQGCDGRAFPLLPPAPQSTRR
ncbi:MAG: alkaline phosphatase family protein [Planctomycetaceae bacterium]